MSHRFDTTAVHAAREDLASLGVHVPPIDLSSTAPVPDVETGGDSYEHLAGGGVLEPGQSTVYQRLWNPTVARFEEALARLEGAEQSVAYASGMAALSAALLAIVQLGRPHVVAVRPLYGGSDHVLSTGLLGTSVTWAQADTVDAAITPDTGLVIVESPGNPTLELVDIAAVVRQAGTVPVLVDNTFATPVLQRPLDLGARMVLHSGTKFLGGHGDLLAGVIATDAEWAARLRAVRALTGGILHPLAAYMAHRGLQTLPVRVRAQQENATVVAAWLADRPEVHRVLHPGMPGTDPGGLLGRQMAGPGAVLAFDVGDYEAAARVVDGVHLITHAVSLGGVDSLIQHPASLTHRPVAPKARPLPGVLRLSVGLEDPADLIADLEQALTR
ncbi:trans-sulfuration enzyme family protein [Mobilicoccus caccae]|uniref:Cystathionine gamma-synthase n=1 Tax=Mobilicoccus caccae TaxID=1859295 RepID=A0ABQ6IX93_9MICO|nr:aminotransferase class I/II-fold pyridoxal phosphate-dependent enzyme [Mobilicoccus caccae]GMA42051.1 cystathionine gamma-synthase [Mobilicoccus caccae]